jgi:hypothetical protein
MNLVVSENSNLASSHKLVLVDQGSAHAGRVDVSVPEG